MGTSRLLTWRSTPDTRQALDLLAATVGDDEFASHRWPYPVDDPGQYTDETIRNEPVEDVLARGEQAIRESGMNDGVASHDERSGRSGAFDFPQNDQQLIRAPQSNAVVRTHPAFGHALRLEKLFELLGIDELLATIERVTIEGKAAFFDQAGHGGVTDTEATLRFTECDQFRSIAHLPTPIDARSSCMKRFRAV